MIKVTRRNDETFEKMLNRFTSACKKDGILKESQDREYYGDRKKRKESNALERRKKEQGDR
ncbi:MAG: 30S ribosomal protein S21 [Clostridiaceae bacterium]